MNINLVDLRYPDDLFCSVNFSYSNQLSNIDNFVLNKFPHNKHLKFVDKKFIDLFFSSFTKNKNEIILL